MSIQLLKATSVTGGMTLISRVLGFVRDMVSAHLFGASVGYDAFIVASKIPNFLRRLFAEGAFSQAFVPILSEYRAKESPAEVQLLINQVGGCLGLILLLVTILGIVAAPIFIMIFAPGFATVDNGTRFPLATEMLRITFPYLLFISLTAFSGGILNSYGRFAAPAFTPVFLNISIILAALFLSPLLNEPVMALAWGILIGGVVQLIFQIPFLKHLGFLPRFQINWKNKGVKRILFTMIPALLGVSVNQFNLMLSSIFASFLPVGSVSWLYYAERLMEFPLGGFGVALATVVLPHLSRHHAKKQDREFSATLDWGIRWILLMGLPASIGLALLSGPLLTTLFQSGKFTEYDVLMSQPCLIAYAAGIMGFMGVKIFASAYYAKHDLKTPVKFAIITVITNVVCSALLIGPLAQMGLALATSIAALLNATLLGWGLAKRKWCQLQPGWITFGLQLFLACSALSFVLLYFNPNVEEWFKWSIFDRIKKLAFLILTGGVVYVITLLAAGLRFQHVLINNVKDKDASEQKSEQKTV